MEPDTYVIHRAEDDQTVAALKRLRKSDQEVLMPAAWEELTSSEIAQTLELSTAAAEQRLHRAKQRFAKILEPRLENSPFASGAVNEGGDR